MQCDTVHRIQTTNILGLEHITFRYKDGSWTYIDRAWRLERKFSLAFGLFYLICSWANRCPVASAWFRLLLPWGLLHDVMTPIWTPISPHSRRVGRVFRPDFFKIWINFFPFFLLLDSDGPTQEIDSEESETKLGPKRPIPHPCLENSGNLTKKSWGEFIEIHVWGKATV